MGEPKRRIQARARVQVNVEVIAGVWSAEETVAHVMEVAGREAEEKVNNLMKGQGRVLAVKVQAVLVDEMASESE